MYLQLFNVPKHKNKNYKIMNFSLLTVRTSTKFSIQLQTVDMTEYKTLKRDKTTVRFFHSKLIFR